MNDKILELEAVISDHVQLCTGVMEKRAVWPANVRVLEHPDISFTLGMAATGNRCSGFIGASHLSQEISQFEACARRRLPIVVHVSLNGTGDPSNHGTPRAAHLQNLRAIPFFQLVAHSAIEHAHYTLLAHRIAELSLVPGMVIADYAGQAMDSIPDTQQIQKFIGSAQEQIEAPTPAQQMVFGEKRRRIPVWFDMGNPVLFGTHKENTDAAFESAAADKFFMQHLPGLIRQAADEYQAVSGYAYAPVKSLGKGRQYAVLSPVAVEDQVVENAKQVFRKTTFGLLNQLNPFPEETIARLLKSRKAITLVHYAGHQWSQQPVFSEFFKREQIYEARVAGHLSSEMMELIIAQMTSGQQVRKYNVEIPFTKKQSQFPKHRIRLQEIESAYPGISEENLAVQKASASRSAPKQDDTLPAMLQNFRDGGPKYARLAPFYDNTAFFYKHELKDELVADPVTAIPVLPPASAGFLNEIRKRDSLPVFIPSNCTGCGDCFTYCPHAALPPVVFNIEDLIRTGMENAVKNGLRTAPLTPVLKNLCRIAQEEMKDKEVSTPADFLPEAFSILMDKLSPEGEKRQELQAAFTNLMDTIGNYPVAVTDDFFSNPEMTDKGSGSLFSVQVDPMTCTGCGVCVRVCPEEALDLKPQDPANLDLAIDHFAVWESLPDTPGKVITRMHTDKAYSSIAAILLSRNYYKTIHGGGYTNQESEAMTMLHLVTSIAESVCQPRELKLLERIDHAIRALREQINQILSESLPTEDISALANTLHQSGEKGLYLREVIENLKTREEQPVIDAELLARKTDLVKKLESLKWSIGEGPSGIGKARFGLVLEGKALAWAAHYPANHFINPCIIQWENASPGHITGICQGVLQEFMEQASLMREVNAEISGSTETGQGGHEPEKIHRYQDLTPEEKKGLTPIFYFIDRKSLLQTGWGKMQDLLSNPYPVKVCVLDHGVPSIEKGLVETRQMHTGLLSTIMAGGTYVFRGGLGNRQDLMQGLADGIALPGPALFHLFSLAPGHHEIKQHSWKDFDFLAMASRAHPHLKYDHAKHGDFLKGSIELGQNQAWKEDWVANQVETGGKGTEEYAITWADWAFTCAEWKSEFRKVDPAPEQVPLTDYLVLDENTRSSKKPVIRRAGDAGEICYLVSDLVVEVTREIRTQWRTWQELAGMRAEHPEKLKAEITAELSASFEEQKQKLVADYESMIQDMQLQQANVFKEKLKEKLLALSKAARKT